MKSPYDPLSGLPIIANRHVDRDRGYLLADGDRGQYLVVHPYEFNVLAFGPLDALGLNIADIVQQGMRKLDLLMADVATEIDNAEAELVAKLEEFSVCRTCDTPTRRGYHLTQVFR